MRNRYKYLLIICSVFLDLLAIVFSTRIFLNFAQESSVNWNVMVLQNLTLVAIMAWIGSAILFRMHHYEERFSLEGFYRCSWRVFMCHWVLVQTYLLFFQGLQNYQFNIGANFLKMSFLLIYLLISRVVITYLVSNLKKWQKNTYNVAIWGFNKTSVELASQLENSDQAINFKGIINEDEPLYFKSLEAFKTSLVAAINYATKKDIQELYVVVQPNYLENIDLFFALADSNCIRLKFIPDFHSSTNSNFVMDNIYNLQVIRPRIEPLEVTNNRLKKRFFDMIFSAFIFIFLLSWLYPILAVMIKLQSKGPVLFKQLRTGENNKEFWCYKFRSMSTNGDSDSLQAQRNDQRVTAIGRFMRKTSLDELPQFYNVWKGEMSIVGPRPHMLKHTFDYNLLVENFMVRHFMKPGITGLSQISGFRGETKEVIDMQNRVDTDIIYLQNWSLIKDIKICLLTVVFAFKGDENAY